MFFLQPNKVYIITQEEIKQNQLQRLKKLKPNRYSKDISQSVSDNTLILHKISFQTFILQINLIYMPIIQLKTQHQHIKKRSQSVALQQKSSPLQSQIINPNINPLALPPNNLKPNQLKQQTQLDIKLNSKQSSLINGINGNNTNNPNNKLLQVNKEKQLPKTQRQPIKKQQKPLKTQRQVNANKKDQKPRKQQKALTVQIVKKQPQLAKSLQKSITQQNQGKVDKKGKKKKKKQSLPQHEQISPQQRINIQTQRLYAQCMQRHKTPFNQDHPQLMILLKQSYKPFAINEVQQQKNLIQSGEDPSTHMNIAKEYNIALFDELNKRKHFHEDRIYLGVLEENQLFNDLIWREEIFSQPKKSQVALLFGDIHLLVINDVWEGEYEIKPKQKVSKDEIIYGSYKANQIRMTESIIKEKLTNLNQEFTINAQRQEPEKFLSHKKFDLNSEDTKKAEQFVKKLQQQEKIIKQRGRKIKQQQEQEEIKRLQQQRQQQKREQQQKIQQRRVKLLQKAEQRQRLKKYRQQQQKQYQQYLSQHRQKTPLFKKKQQDFKVFLLNQQVKKFQQLKQIQKHKRSVSGQQIQLHQLKYKQLKELMDEERRQLMKLQQEQADDRYLSFYKGKFHDSIVSELERKTLGQEKKEKASELYTKKLEYATVVKSKFVPKIDQKKKEELQMLINDLRPKIKDDKLVAEKTKMEGYRNLEKLHQLMGEMRAKGKLKKPQTPQLNTSQQKSSRYINYLNDIKSTRMGNSSMKKSRFTSLDVSKMSRNSLGMIELQAKNLQEQADRKSLFLRNTKNLDMEDYLERKFELEDDYIESAKAKIHLLNKYELGD